MSELVLVVDDEALVRVDLATALGEAGYQVLEASDADHAITALERHPQIRFVITDIHMPGSMDGLRLAHYVRDRWPPVHILVVSGGMKPAPTSLPSRSRFLSKPHDARILLAAMEELASHHSN